MGIPRALAAKLLLSAQRRAGRQEASLAHISGVGGRSAECAALAAIWAASGIVPFGATLEEHHYLGDKRNPTGDAWDCPALRLIPSVIVALKSASRPAINR